MILQVETKKNSTQLAMLYPLHNKMPEGIKEKKDEFGDRTHWLIRQVDYS